MPRIPDELASAMDQLIDPHVGIVRRVRQIRRAPGAPNFFHFAAEPCNTAAFTRQRASAITGAAAADRARAVFKAVGEAVERYCSAIYDVDELPLSTAATAAFPCVEPSEFALFSAAQYDSPGFPWVPFTRETPLRWTPATDVRSDEIWNLPAALVFMPYPYHQGTGDSPIVQPTSAGVAWHSSPEGAALAGAYEVVERDALAIAWQARLSPPQIRLETLDDECYDLAQRFEEARSSLYLLDLTMGHGIPTVIAAVRNRQPERPALVLAAAASLDPGEAARDALEKLAHQCHRVQQLWSRSPPAPAVSGDEFDDVVDQHDHLRLHSDHANAHLAEFLFSSSRRVELEGVRDLPTGDHGSDLRLVADKVGAVGHRLLVADLTSADVRELGLSVARVVIPGFHPLFSGHRIRALGGRRLWEVPQRLGYQALDPTQGDNPAPHPSP